MFKCPKDKKWDWRDDRVTGKEKGAQAVFGGNKQWNKVFGAVGAGWSPKAVEPLSPKARSEDILENWFHHHTWSLMRTWGLHFPASRWNESHMAHIRHGLLSADFIASGQGRLSVCIFRTCPRWLSVQPAERGKKGELRTGSTKPEGYPGSRWTLLEGFASGSNWDIFCARFNSLYSIRCCWVRKERSWEKIR